MPGLLSQVNPTGYPRSWYADEPPPYEGPLAPPEDYDPDEMED